MIEIDRRDSGNQSILKVAGRLGEGTHELFVGMLHQVVQSGRKNVVIDLHGVTHYDQAGYASVKLAQGLLQSAGRSYRLLPETLAG